MRFLYKHKSPCSDRYIFVAPYIVVAFVIFSFCFSLTIFDYIAFLSYILDVILYITYIPIQLHNYKVGHNTSLHKYYKVDPNKDTQVLKTDSMRFWYSTSIINAWHHHLLGRCRSSVHNDHFLVVFNLVYTGDSVNTMQLGI